MLKRLQILFSILLLIVIVIILGMTALIFFIDPNKLKPVIVQEVQKQTGYEAVIDGKLSLSFYPRLGINIAHMTLQAPNTILPFAEFSDVKIASNFSQLWRNREKLQGDITIADVKLFNLHAQQAHIGLHWENNVLTLQPILASLYNGSLAGSAHGQDFSSMPKWDWDVQGEHIALKSLLDDVNGVDSQIKISGTSRVTLQAATQGLGRDQLLKNLNGKSEFSLNNGAVEGIDLNYLVQSAADLLNKQPLSQANALNETAFDSLVGSAVIKNGVANTDNVVLISPSFTAKAQGNIDLVNQTINYQLQISPLHTTKIKGTIPVLITGDLHHPVVRLDLSALNAIITKEQIENVKTKVQEQIKQLPDKADKFLQRILGK